MNLRQLVGVENPVTPRAIHVDEVEPAAGVSGRYSVAIENDRVTGCDAGDDPRVQSGPRILKLPIDAGPIDENPHAAADDPVPGDRFLGLEDVGMEGRACQQTPPDTKRGTATDEIVPDAGRLHL